MTPTHFLDTGWIVRHLRGSHSYTDALLRIGAPRLGLPLVVVAELYEGVHLSADPVSAETAIEDFMADKVLIPLTEEMCRLFGQHRAQLRRQNQLIGDFDLLIATACLSHDLVLLTTNRAHFERVPGLRIVSDPLAIA